MSEWVCEMNSTCEVEEGSVTIRRNTFAGVNSIDDVIAAFVDEHDDDDESVMDGHDLDDSNTFVDEPRGYSDVELSFEIMSSDEVSHYSKKIIGKFCLLLSLPPTTVRSLLAYFMWDEDRMLERYYSEDQEELFAEAKIVNPYRVSVNPGLVELPKEKECPICISSVPSSELISTICGHEFCVECWASYLRTSIMDEGLSRQITCAASGCDTLLDDTFILSSKIDSKAKSVYQTAIIRDFVQCNRLLRWCPTPGCDKVMKVEHVQSCRVTCSCTRAYCFGCGQEWHEPVPCRLLRSWMSTEDSNLASLRWISTNTKVCPKCHMSIEKSGGCDVMTCKNPSCNYIFCWLCLQPNHSAGRCSRHETRGRKKTNRYRFFHDRFFSHSNSLKLEHALRMKMKTIANTLRQSGLFRETDVQFLYKAVDILYESRRTLIYCYVFGYFLKQNNQSIIFEDNRDDLEIATETLSDYLQFRVTLLDAMEMEQCVTDKFRYCNNRRKILVEHTREGIDKDWWLWSEEALL